MGNSGKRLTPAQQRLVKRLAAKGEHAVEIAARLNINGRDAYRSDDFCIAFAEGRARRVA